jgi:putative transposase
MDAKIKEEIAQFRYSLIGPIVSRTNLSHGEKYEMLKKIAQGEYDIPYSTRNRIGLRTLERYLELYEQGNLKALEPHSRDRSPRIPAQYLEEAVSLRRENRRRSIESIISMLEQSGRIPEAVLKRSTVYDHFVKLGIARKQTGVKEAFRKYGASYRGEILQGDVHHTMHLPDPVRDGYNRQVYLFGWIDDFTRLFYGEFYWAEKLPALENTLKKWIIKYSCPVNIYCDNGAVYSSHHLKNICGRLGINLLHSRPYKPMGRGKIEKIFQLVESSFKSEAILLVKEGKLKTLEDLNSYFTVWLDKFYNQRLHSSTKQKPMSMWEAGDNELKKLSLGDIYEAFLYEDEKSVSKTGIIRVETNEYEVESFLAGRKVQARYDPYDLSKEIQVYFEGKRYQDAVSAVIRRHHKKNFVGVQEEATLHTGINHLELLKNESLKEVRGISFAQAMGKEGVKKHDS